MTLRGLTQSYSGAQILLKINFLASLNQTIESGKFLQGVLSIIQGQQRVVRFHLRVYFANNLELPKNVKSLTFMLNGENVSIS